MRLPRASSLLSISIVAALAIAERAGAATVVVQQDGTNDSFAGVYYRAAPGEQNDLLLTSVNDLTIRVRDTGAAITPLEHCRSIDSHTAECTTAAIQGEPHLIGADARLEDLDDVVRSIGPGLSADGGPGDDTLDVRSRVAAVLNGGGGRDTLLGSSNSDELIDGDVSGQADSDVLDGREGGGTVIYRSRTAPLRVDLTDSRGDGEEGEGDVLRSITQVEGGSGADALRGDDGDNWLRGGPGADRLDGAAGGDFLRGGGGADELLGGSGQDSLRGELGADRLDGGPGSDTFSVRREGPDRVSCGTGRGDAVINPNRRDALDPGCEIVHYNFGRYGEDRFQADAYPVEVTSRWAVLQVQCPEDAALDYESVRTSGRIAFREASVRGRLLGAGRIPRRLGRRCAREFSPDTIPVEVRLNARGRRAVSRLSGVAATIRVSGRNLPRAAWTIRLRRADDARSQATRKRVMPPAVRQRRQARP